MSNERLDIRFGLGTAGLGREWPEGSNATIPHPGEVLSFLQFAVDKGVSFIDTAPAYGKAEERLGWFLHSSPVPDRSKLFIATKFGEHWDERTGKAYADHRFEALKKSLNQSLVRLDRVDLLQVHKSTPEVLGSSDLIKALEYAARRGIERFGASVSDLESARIALENDFIDFIQFPFNLKRQAMIQAFGWAKDFGKKVIINRPFAMGELQSSPIDAYKFILDQDFEGVILTGTRSNEHLNSNLRSFQLASNLIPA